MMKQTTHRSHCPISCMLDMLGDKWTLLVLRDMVFEEKSSYGEFMSSDEHIASNILADRLSLLEKDGWVTKKRAPENKSKFVYTPTEKVILLLPLLAEFILAGSACFDFIATRPASLLQELQHNKTGTLKKYARAIRRRIEE